MKLKKYEDKSKKKRKVLLISLGVIVLVSISFLLYKTFAVFNEHVEFPMMNGKVDYFGNSDIYFAFYKKGEPTDTMPEKENSENLVFDHAECDNGAEIEWNESEWSPLIKNLTKNKTKCSLYFDEYKPPFYEEIIKCGQGGTSATTCITNNASLDENLIKDDYDNLRFTGADPSNYVTFNSETWRIIGIIDGKLKIMKNASIGSMKWDSSGNNTWSSSSLASYLNNTYNISSNSMVVSGSWNAGKASYGIAKSMYSSEQKTKWTGKVGLMTASDYGYAVGGSVRAKCLGYDLNRFDTGSCAANDWIYSMVGSSYGWTITPYSSGSYIAFYVHLAGYLGNDFVDTDYDVFPVVYLDSNIKIINGKGTESSPFELSL